ncbi:hypothetical protein TTHERM_00375180 (macronuclear) [Tetrahymena thermophila SB210]|uniref:Uncharacterized protein n=1 Tax=Tetrahymena thermophila (strain SB210) TaxID=312017 RepID=I7MHT6_TETTS|nr:hypothetical protein TTHERM_00375180 [Tetrahymena thermophila SB210]EAR89401.2 hypothetical protein TTHERM_00375180 [Tetrahymena thermophila SB210]|eukprot:XP_001009646.2 hypothetical protein TTHERM_00375180 [Tetrahymena thermophila SB210]
MSSPKLTESPGLNEFQESLQGDTFIVSDKQIISRENIDELKQSDIESCEQKIEDESIDYMQEEEFLCDDLDDFETDMQDIDGEQYLEEQALESYFYSLKKRVLTILYKNYQTKQLQKQSLHQILLRFQAKNYFLQWNELSLQISKETQLQENNIQNGQEIMLSKNSFDQQKGYMSTNMEEFQTDCYNHQQKETDCLSNTYKNKQEVENVQKTKENSESFKIETQNESQRSSKIDKTEYNYEDFQNSNMKSFDQINEKIFFGNQSEDINALKDENQVFEQKEFEIKTQSANQINQFYIDDVQFIDQEQFDERVDGSSNYSSINCGSSQNKENGQHKTQTYQHLNVFQQKSENQKNQNTEQSSTDRSERNVVQKSYIQNTACNSQYLRKDDQQSKVLNTEHQSQFVYKDQATQKVILEQAQPNTTIYQPKQNNQNELQVEQSIYDERSFDTLSTQKLSQSGIQNKFSNNKESDKTHICQPQKNQDFIDSYRKQSSVKLYNLTIGNNFNTLNNTQILRDNEIQERVQDQQIDQNIIQIAQPTFQNFINQKEEAKKQLNKNQSAHLAQQHSVSTNEIETDILNFEKSLLNPQILKDEGQSKSQTEYENSLNQQQSCQISERNKQINIDLRQLKSLEDEDQLAFEKENYFTHRKNDNDHDKRLSQIEAFSISKNIELTPVQQQMILSSHRNNIKSHNTQSISQELEEEQEQAVDDLAHEVAFYIFGKKLFKKLRLAYKTTRTLDRPQSSRCVRHLTQYSSNEQLRIQQVKIETMRKCFDMLKQLKDINKKKKEIQQRLFNYYEVRYIRRPLKIWYQNNKIWLAQKVSFTIISQTMLKLQICEAFKKIKKYSLNKKREDTINNLLKYYERAPSPYLSKSTTLEKKIQTINKTSQNQNEKGLSQIEQNKSQLNSKKHFQSFEELDKENNSILCNMNTHSSQVEDPFVYSRKDSKNLSMNNVTSSNKRLYQHCQKNEEILKNQPNQNSNSSYPIQLKQEIQATTAATNIYQKKQADESQYQKQPNLNFSIQNKNQQQSEQFSTEGEQNLQICKKVRNLRNYQSIQIYEYGINNSTEASDHDLNNYNSKVSLFELNTKTKNSISQNTDISGIISDKSSMVYNCSRNAPFNSGQSCIPTSAKSNHQNLLKTNEEVVNTHKEGNLKNLDYKFEQEISTSKFNKQYEEPPDQNSSLKNSFIFENKNNLKSTFSQINQIYSKNEIQSDRQKSQNYLFDQNTNCMTQKPTLLHKGSSKQFENRALSQRNNLNDLNIQQEATDFICNQKSKFQEIYQPPPHQNESYQKINLTPKRNQQNYNFSNIQNVNSQNQSNSNTIKNQNAFTFTHSQIKNSLSVSTQQTNYEERDKFQINSKEYQQQLLSNITNNSSYQLKEAGKIKKNSFNKSFIEDKEQLDQIDSQELNIKIQTNQKQNQISANTFDRNTLSNRGKHSYSFSQNLNSFSNQDNYTISNKPSNLNNDSNGLISFVNRNRSSSRINQQLEQQAEAFNSKKLNSSRNLQNNLTEKQNQSCNDQMLCSSKIDGQNLFLKYQQGQNNQNVHEIQQFKIQHDRQINNNPLKPPLQHYQQKTDRSSDSMTVEIKPQNQLNIQQQVNKMAKIEQNIHHKSQNFQKDSKNGDLNTLNSSFRSNSKTNYNPHFIESNQIVTLKQKVDITPQRRVQQDESCNQINLSLHQNKESEQYKTTIKYSAYQNQPDDQVNQQEFQHLETIHYNLPQNYLSHLKNKQFSQRIQETAKQIEIGKLPITQQKQEKINQLQQYQYFKQIQQQKSQQQQQYSNKQLSNSSSVNNSFSRNAQKQQNQKNSNKNDSINASQERSKKKDLTGVGQSIQNILYFEAKIRSKRLARSQERSKNDSIELCKKLENLEQYIEQINFELKQEKEKKSLLLEENAQLINQQEQY